MTNTPMTSREGLKELAKKYGGKFHGPNVEHLSIPEQKYFEMMEASQAQQASVIAELKEDLLDLRTQVNYRGADVQRLTKLNIELVEALERLDSALLINHNAQTGAFLNMNELELIKKAIAKVKGK